MELKLGKMTNEELASWFGVKISTISKKKSEYMNKLTQYCDFEKCRGGVIIKEIYNYTVYTKSKNYRIIKDNFCSTWSKTGLDTCRRVSDAIYFKFQNDLTIQEDTAYKYTRLVKIELYGDTLKGTYGEKGRSQYIWCKKVGDYYELLSPEEEAVKQELLKKYFASADEKTAIIQTMIDSGEIKKEEAWEEYSILMKLPHNYPAFLKAFKERTGVQLIKGTLIEDVF